MPMVNRLDSVLAVFGCLCLFAVMWVVGLDALGRNLIDRPITGAYVLIEEYLMPAMIFPLIGYAWLSRAHVGISLLRDRMRPRLRRLLAIFDVVAGLMIFGLITYVGYENAASAYRGGEVTSGLIRWPIWLALVWMPIGGAVFCLRLGVELVSLLSGRTQP